MKSNDIKKLLKKRNLKVTSNRLNLLSKILNNGSAMSYTNIQRAMQPIDRVTLYRTLEKLKEKGIIHTAFQDKKESYYAMCENTCDENLHHHEHVHFKCNLCDQISCEKLKQVISPLEPEPSKIYGDFFYNISPFNLDLINWLNESGFFTSQISLSSK